MSNKRILELQSHFVPSFPGKVRCKHCFQEIQDNPNGSTQNVHLEANCRQYRILYPRQKIASGSASMPVTGEITKQRIDRQLARIFRQLEIPFSTVDDAEFKLLLTLLNPLYEVPTEEELSITEV